MTWLLLGSRAGEIAQMRVVASALDWPVIEKRIDVDPLQAPWPDLVMSFGKDLVLSGTIKRASGGHTKIVQFGRSRGVPPHEIDLLIALPQDCVPPAPNVLKLHMSYNRQDPEVLARKAHAVAPRLARLPRPWTALIVGGASRHFTFDAADAAELGRRASRHAQDRGGSLLVTTSPRTGAASADALREALTAPNEFYAFRPGDADNPLAGYLALADDVIVTGDSSSMLAEAWATTKPVYVSPLPSMRRWLIPLARRCVPSALQASLLARGVISAPVDLQGWIDDRLTDGSFAKLGDAPPTRGYRAADDVDLPLTVQRIRALWPTS